MIGWIKADSARAEVMEMASARFHLMPAMDLGAPIGVRWVHLGYGSRLRPGV